MFTKLILTMNLLLTNARIIDPFGKTEYIENGYILIEDETIVKIGAGSTHGIVVDKTIDLSGKTVLPGDDKCSHASLFRISDGNAVTKKYSS